MIDAALAAIGRDDWPEVLQIAGLWRQRFPGSPEGHLAAAEALRRMERFDAADEILAPAVARFRGVYWLALLSARNAVDRGDWPTALQRWTLVSSRFPNDIDGYVGAAEAHLHLSQSALADAVLRNAGTRLAQAYEKGEALAEAAQRLERLDVAAALWGLLRRDFPDRLPPYQRGAAVLEQSAKVEAADDVHQLATLRFPASEAVWLAAVRIALTRGDRVAALQRWRQLLRHCPVPDPFTVVERDELRKQLALTTPGFGPSDIEGKRWLPGTVICDEPPIILSNGAFLEVVEDTAPFYRDRPAYYFIGMLWTLSDDRDYRLQFKAKYTEVSHAYPNLKLTVLANDVAELLCLRELEIPGELVNHNAFIDDKIFDIRPADRRYDAIYNARIGGYKRHYLAQFIPALKLIATGATEDSLAEVTRLLPGCTIANRNDGHIVQLSASEVAYHLNTAKCGLCLSSAEGAMFASTEYLLCGLPVVTTHNAGGRNWFFANDYVIFCEDDPDDVAAAVKRITSGDIPRQLIRQSARERIRRERLVFYSLVDGIFRELGQPDRRIEPEFDLRFFDKINYVGRPPSEFFVP